MATLLLAGAGSAVGGALGGSLAGLTTMALGRAAGATLGSVVDQRLLGSGSAPVESGRVERFRVMGAGEGAVLPRVFGRVRVAGQIIWSSNFLEASNATRVGGKGGGQEVREFSYSISIAVALCEGEIIRIGRIWADGQPVDQSGMVWRLHRGADDQLPDPFISAIEGDGSAPAYRGTAYVVFENLDLTPYGNRIPQFSFEVFRRPNPTNSGVEKHPALDVRGVALVPGTGEYSLATEPVHFSFGRGDTQFINVNNDRGLPDLSVSLDQLESELPNVESIGLVVSWFGSDLRCDRCVLKPMVEQAEIDAVAMPWVVGGISRSQASIVSRLEDRPLFGGTPADAAVIQAIERINASGQQVMFYPFILMDIVQNNGLDDPWSASSSQPPVPWRGRITLSRAPGLAGSPDKTGVAALEVDAFFGAAEPSDFIVDGKTVRYNGPEEWSYRRFILHYAHLVAIAGGVGSFCIGSEMRSLTQIRDGVTSYPAVRQLKKLAADVRDVLGSGTKIGYAADWSEYFGHQPADESGDFIYHLDPLWSDKNIDFIGIDNYMPLSDWRDEDNHQDSIFGSIYNFNYLRNNVAAGEGFDWYYLNESDRLNQVRSKIEDSAYGEDWVFRYKDIKSWWSNAHVDRVGGVKSPSATDWQPMTKPVWFTELGCAAIDKGTNQPNVFFDPKSSESFYPYFSSGARDEYIQLRYLQATLSFWQDEQNNPQSYYYHGPMVDLSRAHVWAWDARPWPDFPGRLDTWVDGTNYNRGHWLNGRTSLAPLAQLTAEICESSGLSSANVSNLYGGVTGYAISGVESARQSLQSIQLAFGVVSHAEGAELKFSSERFKLSAIRSASELVWSGSEPIIVQERFSQSDCASKVAVEYIGSENDYQAGVTEVSLPHSDGLRATVLSLPITLDVAEAQVIAERYLSEGEIARENITFGLPRSDMRFVPGDIVRLNLRDRDEAYRIDRISEMGHRYVYGTLVEIGFSQRPPAHITQRSFAKINVPTPVDFIFMDLPLLTGDETPHAPFVAASRVPWAGPIAVYASTEDYAYRQVGEIRASAIMGQTLEPLKFAEAGRWMNGQFRVKIGSGNLQSRSELDVLNGANVAALRHGHAEWEILQFRNAELVAPREYILSSLLRGQAGTDWITPEVWPAGSDFVVLDQSVIQLDVSSSWRGLERQYRIGPSTNNYHHPAYTLTTEQFDGAGLRPYRPAHLRSMRALDGAIHVSWTRRTRIDGDLWEAPDVPISESSEQYILNIKENDETIRSIILNNIFYYYEIDEQILDGSGENLYFEVAQISDRFGSGPFARIKHSDQNT